jgi:hypothetical protein
MNSMQATTQAPSADVVAQAAPVPVSVTVTGADGKTQTLQVPRTSAEISQLMARRRQLSDQLESLSGRRDGLVEQLRVAPNVAEPGLTAQLKVLNDRIVQLETDLAATGSQLSAASPELMSTAEERPARNSDDEFDQGMGAGVAMMFVATSILVFFLWRRWKRPNVGRTSQRPDESASRLARLEQGMDAIAVEIERISEGQRFVTRLLSESHGGVLPAQRSGEPTVAQRDQTR